MTRRDFQQLSNKRLLEAQALWRCKLYEGTYHLSGLSVECAIKACIAKKTRRFEFPDKERAFNAFDHDLTRLMRTAGLTADLERACRDAGFNANWAFVKKWEIAGRYNVSIGRSEAEELLEGVTNDTRGIMQWLHLHW